jgi:DNA-binding CsgD family transcriptional regulator
MEDARNRMAISPVAGGFGSQADITPADTGWVAYDRAQGPQRRSNLPENHFRRLTARTADDASPWRAADWALAEIAAANQSDFYASTKDRARLERAAAIVRDSLLEAAQAAADAARRARALAETVDEALTALGDSQRGQMVPIAATAGHSGRAASQLSQREREVLLRVAEGRSNKAIAEELYVSPNTVKTHVASLLRKLDVHTRAQLATIAVQQGLR